MIIHSFGELKRELTPPHFRRIIVFTMSSGFDAAFANASGQKDNWPLHRAATTRVLTPTAATASTARLTPWAMSFTPPHRRNQNCGRSGRMKTFEIRQKALRGRTRKTPDLEYTAALLLTSMHDEKGYQYRQKREALDSLCPSGCGKILP